MTGILPREMSRAILADTGPLYAAVDPDDAHHARAQAELKRLAREKRHVSIAYPTLLEAHALVLRRLGREAASLWIGELLQNTTAANPMVEDYLCRCNENRILS